MIEVMIVVILLGVMATMLVPRFSANAEREFKLAVDQVADLLIVYAQRDHTSDQHIGLQLDGSHDTPWLYFVTLRPQDESGRYAAWETDALIPPVKLLPIVDHIALFADGEEIDAYAVPLSHEPGQDRPTIDIRLSGDNGRFEETLTLGPHDVSPRRLDAQSQRGTRPPRPVDLDREGRSREDW